MASKKNKSQPVSSMGPMFDDPDISVTDDTGVAVDPGTPASAAEPSFTDKLKAAALNDFLAPLHQAENMLAPAPAPEGSGYTGKVTVQPIADPVEQMKYVARSIESGVPELGSAAAELAAPLFSNVGGLTPGTTGEDTLFAASDKMRDLATNIKALRPKNVPLVTQILGGLGEMAPSLAAGGASGAIARGIAGARNLGTAAELVSQIAADSPFVAQSAVTQGNEILAKTGDATKATAAAVAAATGAELMNRLPAVLYPLDRPVRAVTGAMAGAATSLGEPLLDAELTGDNQTYQPSVPGMLTGLALGALTGALGAPTKQQMLWDQKMRSAAVFTKNLEPSELKGATIDAAATQALRTTHNVATTQEANQRHIALQKQMAQGIDPGTIDQAVPRGTPLRADIDASREAQANMQAAFLDDQLEKARRDEKISEAVEEAKKRGLPPEVAERVAKLKETLAEARTAKHAAEISALRAKAEAAAREYKARSEVTKQEINDAARAMDVAVAARAKRLEPKVQAAGYRLPPLTETGDDGIPVLTDEAWNILSREEGAMNPDPDDVIWRVEDAGLDPDAPVEEEYEGVNPETGEAEGRYRLSSQRAGSPYPEAQPEAIPVLRDLADKGVVDAIQRYQDTQMLDMAIRQQASLSELTLAMQRRADVINGAKYKVLNHVAALQAARRHHAAAHSATEYGGTGAAPGNVEATQNVGGSVDTSVSPSVTHLQSAIEATWRRAYDNHETLAPSPGLWAAESTSDAGRAARMLYSDLLNARQKQLDEIQAAAEDAQAKKLEDLMEQRMDAIDLDFNFPDFEDTLMDQFREQVEKEAKAEAQAWREAQGFTKGEHVIPFNAYALHASVGNKIQDMDPELEATLAVQRTKELRGFEAALYEAGSDPAKLKALADSLRALGINAPSADITPEKLRAAFTEGQSRIEPATELSATPSEEAEFEGKTPALNPLSWSVQQRYGATINKWLDLRRQLEDEGIFPHDSITEFGSDDDMALHRAAQTVKYPVETPDGVKDMTMLEFSEYRRAAQKKEDDIATAAQAAIVCMRGTDPDLDETISGDDNG
jgi:hypothetical protein